jgi:hypothetical protein
LFCMGVFSDGLRRPRAGSQWFLFGWGVMRR